ncbi:hypothetical protein [Acidiphilium sp. C61]|uniref:hypothetical protein n=1 Tax=Acidiphilium sp. C61 TaxID=1671485 RepID=UPI00157A2970|nr:hypothetical protein [Acidiphilium sp. C61]
MAILGGIIGSLVDYDNGGVSSAARREYEIQKYADRAAEISNRKQVQSDRERIAQLEQELAQTKRALGACPGNGLNSLDKMVAS